MSGTGHFVHYVSEVPDSTLKCISDAKLEFKELLLPVWPDTPKKWNRGALLFPVSDAGLPLSTIHMPTASLPVMEATGSSLSAGCTHSASTQDHWCLWKNSFRKCVYRCLETEQCAFKSYSQCHRGSVRCV